MTADTRIHGDVAVITLNNPPVNGLGLATRQGIAAGINQANADLGLPAMREWDPAKRGAADSSFVAADVDVLAGLGAAGQGVHAEGETLDLASIPRQALRSAILMHRLANTPR